MFLRVFEKNVNSDLMEICFEIQILESFLERSRTFSLEVEDFFIRYHGFYIKEKIKTQKIEI